MGITVRPAQLSDIPELARVLGIAFCDDPIVAWLIRDDATRARRASLLFTAQARHHFIPVGGAEVACNDANSIVGVALWAPPGRWHVDDATTLRQLPSLVRAFRHRLPTVARMAERMMAAHPREPHWYLAAIGTLPGVRGCGYGRALLDSRLERCDAEGLPAYLESSKPANVPYYERFGFETDGTLDATDGGPPLWPMWRTPR
ncbi:GNAT family N-acetyltransferase [Nocardia seriolae]|uniref:GNAT family acetyltransferase n=1 Tax=Nocardia seriolae TaxID=37332 RepID=A0ABC8AX16_9NOCA|nr:GNAT family N-acetyltransferase [Nocardia seriolae]APA98539.1 Puromycin N-acetyltransferase [Nocardia seriolae]OJF80548.1 GNAT family N-acetyltransferase [Nocardia seriolae]PSK28233.1 N-acetyltransferase [Nocardia seriolae]QOW35476.1 GNAT family N-acetyltransferase [Nocardia seriolae]QUN17015.1 GNAT family N-acetyltransferase [Nocardia seriolae]